VKNVRIEVEQDLCMANGQCVSAAPQLFALTDDGELLAEPGPVRDELVAKAEQAVRLCPTQALRLDEL